MPPPPPPRTAAFLCLVLLASFPSWLVAARGSDLHSSRLPRDPTKRTASFTNNRFVEVATSGTLRGGFLGRRNNKSNNDDEKERNDKKEKHHKKKSDKEDEKSLDSTSGNEGSTQTQQPETTTNTQSPEEVLLQASELRQQGKELHDSGDFSRAAETFGNAANLLEAKLQALTDGRKVDEDHNNNNNDEDDDSSIGSVEELEEELATCRLHESLCHLKAQQFDQCIKACSALLDSTVMSPPAMIRARAYHRRAKAKLELDNIEEALVDARSAAFLGDRKAVALYGKLMREQSGASTSYGDDMFARDDESAQAARYSLLESLINKSSKSSAAGGAGSDLLASTLLGQLGIGGNPLGAALAPGGFAGSRAAGAGGSLAKSVLSSLSKTLEDESTHEKICTYLKSTNPMQVQSMANMAGLQLSGDQASKLVSVAHGVTPRTIRTTVKTTKWAVWGFKLLRKISQVISKYKNIIFLLFLLQWTKSAILRPIPVPVPKVKAAKAPSTTLKPATTKTPETKATKATTTKALPPRPGAVVGGIL